MLMALFQNKESLSSNKTTRVCGQADKNVQLQARPRGLIGVRRKFNLLLHPIVIRRLTVVIVGKMTSFSYNFHRAPQISLDWHTFSFHFAYLQIHLITHLLLSQRPYHYFLLYMPL